MIDAVDTVSGKLALIEAARAAGTPIISCMGAGNKLDPTAFRVADIYETSVCPLARIMRSECRKRGIPSLKVVYSTEPPLRLPAISEEADSLAESRSLEIETASLLRRRATPGSVSFVPAVAGLILAGEVIRDLSQSVSQRDKES